MPEPALPVTPIATISSYDDLLAVCRQQVQRLGFNYDILDIVAGFNVGYATKLFTQVGYVADNGRPTRRHFSRESFDAYFAALGLKLAVIEDADRVARSKAFAQAKLLKREAPLRAVGTKPPVVIKLTHNHMKRIARLGGLARGRKLHARAELREIKRKAAIARWSKRRQHLTSDLPADQGLSAPPPA